ncbi:MAG: YHYH domain-containing protein [Candidatus Velamenicoccus archaeovorus]
MKNILLLTLLMFLLASFFTGITLASKPVTHPKYIVHPGRTDSQGCHHCWTNCARWGLAYGEYHCH